MVFLRLVSVYTLLLSLLSVNILSGKEYHVAVDGSDVAPGTAAQPFRTINHAAGLAMPGDTVTVHAGTYREWVNPLNGGIDDSRRILFRAAEGELVEIKGSEPVSGWKKEKDGVWSVSLPNSFFGDYNPFADKLTGDWFHELGRPHHTADVYLNDVSLYEVESREIVARRDTLMKSPRDPDGSPLRWYAVVDDLHTTIYACFGEADPRRERVEVTARPTCFYPLREGVNFLTIRGFHISQAATQWGAPTAEQVGMIAVHWGKGWIIEDNVISNSRCNGITLGKEFSTGHNLWSQRGLDGATEYVEVTLSALRKGWDKEHVGSHVIRRNEISFCEQTGICGSLGGAFSEIHDNHIHDIWVKNQFIGEEIGGIKLHGAVDAYIHNNRIHHCQKGIWMDWMAQGSRVSCNLLYDNFWMDLYYEVNHGPAVCDNNILLSPWALWDMSEGIAYVHNLVGGFIAIGDQGRFTPYHLDHSTEIKGLYQIICGDDRFYNNIFVNKPEDKEHTYGMDSYSGANWPVFAEGNTTCTDLEAGIQETGDGEVFLSLSLSGPVDKVRPVDSDRLGITRVSNYPYEHVDGSKLYFRKDFLGHERDSVNPVSGPFEQEYPLRVKVW